ncbi:MAG TPA: ribosome silencing factor [Solirubrobacterales bacterium]|nr:ribosome silencing factor [Solirubrobacterales bacterium]
MGLSSQELTEEIARMADAKLAEDIVALDMRDLVTYTDFLVVCTARNERQAEAIADDIHIRMKQTESRLPVNPDRSGDVGWTVLDYLDCVLHVFTAEARERFDLEELWHEAPRLELTLDPPRSAQAPAA